MKIVASILATLAARVTAGTILTPGARVLEDIAIPTVLSCPDPVPVEGSSCNLPFNCEFDIFCCPEDDTICVPETSCTCDEMTSTVLCYEKIHEISCPSLCPTTSPETNDACFLENHFLCNYGNPMDCQGGERFDFERQCSCFNGAFVCMDNVCSVSCPAVQPEDGNKCLPFATGSCEYGNFCCPGKDGQCTRAKSCHCNDMTASCYDTSYSIPCPEVCPELPPNSMDLCDIDRRFDCNYGDAFSCENSIDGIGGSLFDFEKQCSCVDGIFSCAAFACPVKCPDVQPTPRSSCSPFINYSCGYGEICCPETDGKNCVSMTECSCDDNLKSICYEPPITCPSLCPTEAKNGQACDLEERYRCTFSSGSCSQMECKCEQGIFICDEICMEDDGVPIDENENDEELVTMPKGKQRIPTKNKVGKVSKKGKKKEKKSNPLKEGKKLKKPKKEKQGKSLRKGKKA